MVREERSEFTSKHGVEVNSINSVTDWVREDRYEKILVYTDLVIYNSVSTVYRPPSYLEGTVVM